MTMLFPTLRRLALTLTPLLGIVWTACDAGAEVGIGLVDENGGVFVTDTLTLRTSTVLLDSVATQQAAHLLVGAYTDAEIGRVEARGYVPLDRGGGFEPPDAAVYDSLTLRLRLGYGYGALDTPQTLQVHRVLEPIEPDEDDEELLTSLDAFTFDPMPLGASTFVPEDESEVEIRLSDALGTQLFEAAQDGASILTDDEAFESFLRGLVIVSEAGSSVLGFEAFAQDTALVDMRLYYRDDPGSDATQQRYVFAPTERTFSSIQNERVGPLEQLAETRSEVATAVTGETGYVAGGTGLALRIEIPTAYRLLFEEGTTTAINNARLYLFPVGDTYDDETPLPRSLELFVADENNEGLVSLLNTDDTPVTSGVSIDEEFGRGTRYAFDVTRFIEEEIEAGFDTERGLLVLPTAFDYVNTVNRVAVGGGDGGDYQAILQVVYTRF